VDSLGSQMHGYFAKPQREGKFPVLVMYQGARLKKRLNRLGRIFHYPVFKGPASL
jgi:dienelactone hydrolase